MQTTWSDLVSVAEGACLYTPVSREERQVMRLYANALELAVEPDPILTESEVLGKYEEMAKVMAAHLIANESGNVYPFRIPEGGRRLDPVWERVREIVEPYGLIIQNPFDIAVSNYGRKGTVSERSELQRLHLPPEIAEELQGKMAYGLEDIIESGGTLEDAANKAVEAGLLGLVTNVLAQKPVGSEVRHPNLDVLDVIYQLDGDAWVVGANCLDYSGLFRNLLGLFGMRCYVVKPVNDIGPLTPKQKETREAFEKIAGYRDQKGQHVDGELDKLTVCGQSAVDFIESLPPMTRDQILACKDM